MRPINTKNNFLKNEGSFTIIEMLIVVVMISILSAIILANYSAGQKELALQRAANKLAQDIRRAQEMTMSADDFGNPPPTPSTGGYGIEFNSNNLTYYILFADCNEDGIYTVTGSSPQCYGAKDFTGYPEKAEQIYFEKDITISALFAIISGAPVPTSPLRIIFIPPSPDAKFNNDPNIDEAVITLTSGSNQKNVRINKAGLIKIE